MPLNGVVAAVKAGAGGQPADDAGRDLRRPQRQVRGGGQGDGRLQRAGVQRVGLSVKLSSK